ncbi:FAD-dependent monooxygenase [Cyanobium sp. Morenito 9A2]|uniref:FAD-dependent monooxygenase n=1 Tax=Cyanobium sp. Morenito 9A2 TaxID=2823718 RepID=UPI0020CFB08F|nr:FAD-dependent monooxygenase [Cyanobium sp. Morenito 9A2]MCP9848767.1 FAD-dependent monooxygenase [Cyanobium sp. Morenito 9A2]
MRTPLLARVVGAGPTGALAALVLAQAGWRVQLLDPLGPEPLKARSRAYALSHSSQELLEAVQLWDALEADLVPFRQLELCDLSLAQRVPFSTDDLGGERAQHPSEAVGWILDHSPLMTLLLDRLGAHPAVELQLGGGSDSSPSADRGGPPDWTVVADGGRSSTRAALGIGHWSLPYRQGCLTVKVRLRGSAPDQAWELFRPEGPFAVLPLGGDRFQLVWSAPAERLRRLEGLDPVAFLEALSGVLPQAIQVDALLDQPRAYPVALELARRLHRGNALLVGETAHRCHPVGGQGLNLCWRDVAELRRQAGRVSRGRLAPQRLGAAYAWRRWGDVLLTLLATDVLVRLFSNRFPPARLLRGTALTALKRWAPLRALALALMTFGPCRRLFPWSE